MPTATLTQEYKGYIPVIRMSKPAVWEAVDPDDIKEGAISLAICSSNPDKRYLGTLGGLFVGNKGDNELWTWKPVPKKGDQEKPLDGQVRDVLVAGNDCDDVYAATLDKGVWRVEGGKGIRLDKPGDAIPPATSVILRGGLLFVGTTGGIRVFDTGQEKWESTEVKELITKQSLSGSRIYAAAWTAGVRFNSCDPDNKCAWGVPPSQPDNKYVRDVTGDPGGKWIAVGTASGVFHWDGKTWRQPVAMPPGDVFALAQTSGGGSVFAAVEGRGIWYWNVDDAGLKTSRLGDLSHPVIDLTVADGYLYATTTNFGIWRWPLR